MDTQVAASPEAMMELAENTGILLKKIVQYNGDLSAKLESLGSDFRDEGFGIIREHIQKTKGKISESLPDFQIFLGKLVEIANAYKKSRDTIEEKDGLNWATRNLAIPAIAIGMGSGAMGAVTIPQPIVRSVTSGSELSESIIPNNIKKNPVANNFKTTQQKWVHHKDGSKTYDSPVETGKTLNYNQGKAIKGFRGTCGLVSSANILKLAGINASEKDMVEFCSKNVNNDFFSPEFGKPLCTINDTPDNNGGTTSIDRQLIMAHFGVKSERQEQTVDNIAAAVEAGKGVIISVNVKELRQVKYDGHHAIIVTSVKRDKDGKIDGFWVTDSGTAIPEPATYYSKDVIGKAITETNMNVTTNIIR
jgi:hypothetical protein